MTTSGHRNFQRELPPKMAQKVSSSNLISTQQQYTYQQQYSSFSSQQPYQPRGSQPIYGRDNQYQYSYSKPINQTTHDYRNLPPSKRPMQPAPPPPQPKKEEQDEHGTNKPLIINRQDPPKSFNIIRRGNLPGLFFEQVFIKAD